MYHGKPVATHHITIVISSLVHVEPDLPLAQKGHDLVFISHSGLLDQTARDVESNPVRQLEARRVAVRMVESLVGWSEDRKCAFMSHHLEDQLGLTYLYFEKFRDIFLRRASELIDPMIEYPAKQPNIAWASP